MTTLGALYAGEIALERQNIKERCRFHAERLYTLFVSAAARKGSDVTVVQGEKWWSPYRHTPPRTSYLPDAQVWFLALPRTFWQDAGLTDVLSEVEVALALHHCHRSKGGSRAIVETFPSGGIFFAPLPSTGVFAAFQEDVERRVRACAERVSESLHAPLLDEIAARSHVSGGVQLTLRNEQPFGFTTRQFWSHLEATLQERLAPECLRVVKGSTRAQPYHTPFDIEAMQKRFDSDTFVMTTLSVAVMFLPLPVTLPIICSDACSLNRAKRRARTHTLVLLELEPTGEAAWPKPR